MKKILSYIVLLSFPVLMFGSIVDPLPSWNEGEAKQSILKFLDNCVDERSTEYIRPEDRVAALDLDGTLIAEWPVNFQRALAVKKLRQDATEKKELREVQPYKSAWHNDEDYYNDSKNHSFVFLKAFEGVDQREYVNYVKDFYEKDAMPYWNLPVRKLFYRPGLELVKLLKDRGFMVYICSTTEEGCIRVLLEEALGIDPVTVIGNEVVRQVCDGQGCDVNFKFGNNFRQPENRGEHKSVYFTYRVGKRPVFGFGNSSGDISMLKLAASEGGFAMILDHDDAQRELKYRSEELLEQARQHNWVVASMKRDFAVVFDSK